MAGRPAPPLAVPPGYRSLVPLDRERHAGLGVSAAAARRFGSALDAVYLTLPEFFQAARHFVAQDSGCLVNISSTSGLSGGKAGY